ncbi:YchJ family protein [Chromobacterium sp. IIBBL 290-4]|uniref:YchJ family protein n=1 Tax=Chromobacterium sp. IIBBL 290-4 TaxID=2953890 RepID=UPI0020B6B5F1|nr:YchJ family protein [Chromobacterium sp. IIBBL 290-4]UTH72546.1 YchJ family protein [Chromobacterium sp. IIBBL 290-4]
MKSKKQANTACPCGGESLAACCGRYHHPDAPPAPTAQALMRARYSAFALGLEDYLLATWHPSTRPEKLDLEEDAGVVKWIGLEILRCEAGLEGDSEGAVEFVARWKVGGKAERMRETSRFVREDGRWYYLSGQLA